MFSQCEWSPWWWFVQTETCSQVLYGITVLCWMVYFAVCTVISLTHFGMSLKILLWQKWSSCIWNHTDTAIWNHTDTAISTLSLLWDQWPPSCCFSSLNSRSNGPKVLSEIIILCRISQLFEIVWNNYFKQVWNPRSTETAMD